MVPYKFIASYIKALRWTEEYPHQKMCPHTWRTCIKDCLQFHENNRTLLEEAQIAFDYTDEQAGHDFWLTRNGHGAGFWNRELGKIGEQLTDAAHHFKEFEVYLDDDSIIRHV